MFKTKKAQTGGLITGLIFGVASLVIAVIIAFVIVSTLTSAGLFTAGRGTVTITDESGITIDATGDDLGVVSDARFSSGSVTVTEISGNLSNGLLNQTAITAANYTISASGVITNATVLNWVDVHVNYTYTQKSNEETSSGALSANFTKGVDNVSAKIPTVLLVAAIVLILSVLVLLVGAWQRMRIGGGSI